MTRPAPAVEHELAAFVAAVESALGDELLCLVLHGSAAGEDWVPGRSDLNTVVVVPRVTLAVLERLAPVVGRFAPRGFALPVVMDREYLAQARDTFPMELDDIRRQHRLLAGTDCFATLELDPGALRRECEHEARGKLLRLRARFLEVAGAPDALERLMTESAKSFLVVLRHLARLRHVDVGVGYAAALGTGERLLGPLPLLRRILDRREGRAESARALGGEFGTYLAEVERIVAAVDAVDA